MVEITKPSAYLKQIYLYLKNGDNESAYSTSKDFVAKFPQEMPAHFLLALSALKLNKFDETRIEGRKAFNMAVVPEDMFSCALICSLAYFELKEYAKGYELLTLVEKTKKTDQLEELLVLFSLAINNPEEAFKHEEELSRLNARAADDLLMRLMESFPPE